MVSEKAAAGMKAQAVEEEEEEEEAAQGCVGSGSQIRVNGAAPKALGFWRCRAT